VALKGNDHDAFWQRKIARTRCGPFFSLIERFRILSVAFFNSHNPNFASWQFLFCQNALWLF
jgi:hypothetical protein